MKIRIRNLQSIAPVDAACLRRGIRAALTGFAPARRTGCELSVALVDDAEIARLGGLYLNAPRPTDVIAFPLDDDADALEDPQQPPPILGEIVISVETARREARKRKKAIGAEVLLYAIHGALHLVGYDDTSPAAAQTMKHKQEQILARVLKKG